jgi:hypothetical protein
MLVTKLLPSRRGTDIHEMEFERLVILDYKKIAMPSILIWNAMK